MALIPVTSQWSGKVLGIINSIIFYIKGNYSGIHGVTITLFPLYSTRTISHESIHILGDVVVYKLYHVIVLILGQHMVSSHGDVSHTNTCHEK